MSNDEMTNDDKIHAAEHELESEIRDYLKEKDRIRDILGKIGGKPGQREKAINILFIVLVALTFVTATVSPLVREVSLEVAILLVSVKLIYVLSQNAKINHFQFWMLSTLEWRLNEMAKDISKMEKSLGSKKS
jgi:hypothetical protein